MDAIWSKLFESGGVSGIWIVIAFLISNVVSFLTARGTSKDKAKSDLLATTIKRQDALDKRQQQMMDDLQEEIRRVKVEMGTMQKEAAQQQKRNSTLSEKYTNLLQENHSLQAIVIQMQKEKDELNIIVKELGDKNTRFMEQIRLLTEEIRKKRV